jgi:hypothetical protein
MLLAVIELTNNILGEGERAWANSCQLSSAQYDLVRRRLGMVANDNGKLNLAPGWCLRTVIGFDQTR